MKNSFTNPVHPSRKIYVIFDVPHIIKCIRNVFVSKRVFDTQDGLVKMEHFETVYSEDIKNPPGLRNAPRLQREHLHPNNFQKQCVATAVQLFGGTVAKAMEFYKNRGIKQLEESGPTICFINRINTLFDALNRKLPSHGIRLNSSDLIEIELAISWLNNWEVHIKEKHPQNWKKLFLSCETSQNLRISLNSILQLSNFLLKEQKFSYVLSARFNQDPLEMFFGLIRQGSGSDTHPTTLQFLYLFRLMSVSNLVQPPKRASVNTQPLDLLPKLHAIANLKKGYRQQQLKEFFKKLENVLSSEQFSSPDNDLFSAITTDHNYFKAEVKDCLIYFLGGYIIRKLLHTSCDDCILTIKSEQSALNSLSAWTDIKSAGYLLHPTKTLFDLLCFAECIIEEKLKDIKSAIFPEIAGNILSSPDLLKYVVGCSNIDHKTHLTGQVLHFFIVCRLFFFTREYNNNSKSKLKTKSYRKEACLQ